MDQEPPIRQFRPVVVPAQYLVIGPLAAVFFSLFPCVFTFVISNILRAMFGGMSARFEPLVWPALVAYLGSFALVMGLVYLKMFKEPERTLYSIYPDRLEYDEGFLNKQRRTVVFDQIIDIQLTEGLLQQTKGVGTIVLTTQQLMSSGEGRLSNRQVALHNVPEPREVYELLQSLAKTTTS